MSCMPSIPCLKRKVKRKKKQREDDIKFDIDEHEISVEDVCERYRTDPVEGLNSELVAENQKKYGVNRLKPPKALNPYFRFFVLNFQGADCLAAIGVFLCITNYIIETLANVEVEADIEKIYVAITLSMFIVYVGIVSYIIESNSAKLLEELRLDIANLNKTSVIRNGMKHIVSSKELTIGDLVEIQAGDRIPAGIRVIEVTNFRVDNSLITQDSAPITATVEPMDKHPLKSKNILFANCLAVSGRCKGIVIKVGESTLIAHFERENPFLNQIYTPLIHEFNKLVFLYCGIGTILSLTFTFLAMRLNYKFLDVTTTFITMFIAFVPEKLLVCLHMSHKLAASRLRKKHCLIKHFAGIESLGRCSVICCGISRILTENTKNVSQIWFGSEFIEINFLTTDQYSSERFGILIRSMHLNLARHMKPSVSSEDPTKLPIRNKVELAVVQYLRSLSFGSQESEIVYEVPFSSARSYQLSIHKVDYDERFLLVAMGAPRTILDKCSTILYDYNEAKITPNLLQDILDEAADIRVTGEQLLGFCEIFLPLEKFPRYFDFNQLDGGFPYRGFRFVGFVSLSSQIRPLVPESLQKCKDAGIRVFLMAADHPKTVEGIARATTLFSKRNALQDMEAFLQNPKHFHHSYDKPVILTGEILERMSDRNLKKILDNYKEIAFAKIRPNQKIRIIDYFQKNGEIVAVTGRNVSDESVLSKANIAIAPASGYGIARQSCDLIIEDEGLPAIVNGIEEGRLVFENFRKSVCFELTAHLPKLVPFLLYLILRIPLPLGAVAILCIDIGIDFLSAVSLSFEGPEPHFMKTPPRKSNNVMSFRLAERSYFHIGVLETCAGLLVYFVMLGLNGFLPDRLVGLRDEWLNDGIDDLEDSYGQQWTFKMREQLEDSAHAGYFFAIVVTQVANLISSRTNVTSIFRQKTNWTLYIVIVIEVCFASILASVNLGLFDHSLKFHEIKWSRVLLMLPFAVLIIVYDELRKLLIRAGKKVFQYL